MSSSRSSGEPEEQPGYALPPEHEHDLDRYRQRLYDITTDASLDFEGKLHRLLAFGCEELDVENGHLTRIDPDREVREVLYAVGSSLFEAGWITDLDETYCRDTIETDGIVSVYNALEEGLGEDPARVRWDLECYIGARVIVAGEPYGTLCFANQDPRAEHFLPAEKALVDLMARWVSQALERHRHEQELEAEKENLAAANERLRQLTYAASHDLQEPVRTVTTYLQLIEQRYGDRLDEEGRAFFAHAQRGARRMRWMVQGLLELANVTKRARPLEPTDSQADVARVLEELEPEIEAADAEVTVGELPRVRADPSQLVQLFRHLLANALSHGGGTPPRVSIDAEPTDEGWRFSVRDEGVGIAEAHTERIFGIFRQLEAESEGPGVGLAICEQIVDRHGGEMWVESEPGEGSTFRFTLPRASVDRDG